MLTVTKTRTVKHPYTKTAKVILQPTKYKADRATKAMPSPKPIPAYVRYFRARLRLLAQPAFWVSSVVLVLTLMFAWEYFLNPESISSSVKNTGNAEKEQAVDAEDTTQENQSNRDNAAIGIDIDNLQLLETQLNREQEPSTATLPNFSSNVDNQQGLLEELSRKQKQSNNEAKAISDAGKTSFTEVSATPKNSQNNVNNPFAPSTADILNKNLPSNNNSIMGVNLNRDTSSNSSQNSPLVSPLTAALKEVQTNSNSTAPNNSRNPANASRQEINSLPSANQQITQLPNNSSPDPTNGLYPNSSANNPQNAFTYLTQPQPIPAVPEAAPIPQALPVAPVAPTNSNIEQYTIQTPTQNSRGANPNFTTQMDSGLQPIQSSQPNFTAPRPIPGRYIGGGEINTFSNP